MTTIRAETILSSQHVQRPDIRLSTLLLTYPRAIHAEFMTHRQFSRNAGSSRAIPVSKMIQDVMDNPFIPLHWGKNQKGMQATEECNDLVDIPHEERTFGCFHTTREKAWLWARDRAVETAKGYANAGYHKQIVNRLLEPFMHIRVVVSSTEWSNFLALRDHPDAEPHIAMLAREIRKELEKPAMQVLQPGQWHTPFVNDTGDGLYQTEVWKEWAIPMASACCASTSYKTVDGFDMTIQRANAIFDKLVEKPPLHASPFEHVAKADEWNEWELGAGMTQLYGWLDDQLHGNFQGFCQYRKMLPNECL